MSILIKGIDLPKKIKGQHQHSSEYEQETYIELYIRSDGVVFDDDFEEVGQAIQIPRPHGRLIDGDKLSIEFESQCAGECADCMFEERCVIIDDIAPTILEAEE